MMAGADPGGWQMGPMGVEGDAQQPPAEQEPVARYTHRTMPQPLQEALKKLRDEFQSPIAVQRREYVKKCLKLHSFFEGNQYIWWRPSVGAWQVYQAGAAGPATTGSNTKIQSLYPLNFLQGFVLAIISLLSGSKMTTKFWADDPNNEKDRAAEKRYDAIIKSFRQNERSHAQLVKAIYLLCTDGTFGSYVRTVVDGERFGYLEEPIEEMQDQEIGPPSWQCALCGARSDQGGLCQNPECGAPLPEIPNVPAPTTPMPVVTGMRKIPRGRTVRDIVPGLELKLPPTADDQPDFLWLFRTREVMKASARATYPDIADKIGSQSEPGTGDGNQALEKQARLQASMGTTVDARPIPYEPSEYVTYDECWFRKKAFYQIDDAKVREQLIQMFPDGAYVALANDVFCEARQESMDDHWRICHALPGRGQIRQPIFGALVPVQEAANDLFNIIRDIIEFTQTMVFVDPQLYDVRKLGRSPIRAGEMVNVVARGSRPVSEGFFQTQPGQLPEYATTLLDKLRTEWAQFISGAFPAAYGGGSPGNSTAQGIEIERNAALGRIGLYLRALTEHYASIAPLIVKDFKDNAIEPIEILNKTERGTYEREIVTPEDARIGKAHVIPEVDEEYPTTWPQRQALLLQSLNMPQFQGMISLLSNLDSIKSMIGIEQKLPGEDAYKMSLKQIEEALQSPPQPGPDVPVVDEAGMPMADEMGQPMMQPGPPMPSIEMSPLDDNPSMLQAIVDFYMSDRAETEKVSNPEGYMNVMLLGQARQAAMAAMMAQQLPAQEPDQSAPAA